MQRRTFIGGGAALAATAVSAACTGGGSGPRAGGEARTSGTPLKTTSTAAAAGLKALAHDLDGPLVRPGEANWAAARQLYNTRFDSPQADGRRVRRPRRRHPHDAWRTPGAHDVPVSIRNGGHSYAGWSSGNGRLIVDVSKLAKVRATGDDGRGRRGRQADRRLPRARPRRA